MNRTSPIRTSRVPYFLLALTLLSTLLATYLTARSVQRDEQGRFRGEVATLRGLIERRFGAYEDVLNGARGLFVASEDVGRRQFATYADSLELRRRYPGIQGLGYSRTVRAAELETFEKQQVARGDKNFALYPQSVRDLYQPVTYLAPLDDANRVAIGFDMFSETRRRAAMNEARDNGQTVATESVTLVQEQAEGQKQQGFLIYAPLYNPEAFIFSLEQRRAALRGFVYIAFRVEDFIVGIDGLTGNGVGFELFDNATADPAHFLYRSYAPKDALERYTQNVSLEVAGRVWLLKAVTLEGFVEPAPWSTVWVVLVSGLLISLLIFSLSLAQSRARMQAETMSSRLQSSQSALNRARAEFETMFSAMADVAVLFDKSGQVIRSNAALWNTFGLNPERFKGHPIEDLYAEARPERASRFRADYRRVDGSHFPGETHRSAVYSSTGEIIGYVEIIRDITETLAADAALQNALNMQRTFLAETSHELRTPLTGVLGYLRQALRASENSPAAKPPLEDAIRVGESMSRLVADLLQLSRGEMVQEHIPHFVDLSKLVEQVARDHKVRSRIEDPELETIGDPSRLSQMLTNLIGNAIRVCGDPNMVWVRAYRASRSQVALEVVDCGPGIPDDLKARIFEKFYRGKEAGSAGLGLTISMQIARAHGTNITVHDTPGGGATFRILLDALTDDDDV